MAKNSDGASWQDALRGLLPDDYTPEAAEPEAARQLPLPHLTITLDRKRAGKTATIISGFDPDDERAAQLAGHIKKALATGGSARGGEILLQGDRRDDVAALLRSEGYKVTAR